MKKMMTIGMCIALFFVLAGPNLVFGAAGFSKVPESILQQLDVQAQKGLTPEALKVKRQQLFDTLDSNKDGLLSRDELAANEKTIFTKLDTNKDGFLTPNEIKKEWKVYYDKLDRKKVGKVSPDDLSARLDEVFKIMDGSDQDGFVTKDEYFLFWANRDSEFAKGKAN